MKQEFHLKSQLTGGFGISSLRKTSRGSTGAPDRRDSTGSSTRQEAGRRSAPSGESASSCHSGSG